jgi:hypothetical protein
MFRVYVNYPNNKAIVHRESCGCYRGIDKTHNGYWKHGFETAEQALEFARNRHLSRELCLFIKFFHENLLQFI